MIQIFIHGTRNGKLETRKNDETKMGYQENELFNDDTD